MFYPTLMCSEARALIKDGAQLVDVRSPQEHQQHLLPGSVNIPLPVITRALKQLDKETPVLLYCASGQRSGAARRILEACGFTTVHNVGSLALLHTSDRTHSQ
jgi:phage shock protein E